MELLALWFLAALELLAIYYLLKLAKKSSSKIKAHKGSLGPIRLIILWSGIFVPIGLIAAYIYFFLVRN